MDFILIRGVLTIPATSVIPAEHELGLGCHNCTNIFTSVKCVLAVGGREAPFKTHLTGLDKVILYETEYRLEGDLSVTFLRSTFLSTNIQSALQQEGRRHTGNSSRPLRRSESFYK